MSLWSVAFLGTTPIGGPLVGFIGGSLGARYSLGIGAVAAIGAGIFGLVAFGRHPGRQSVGPVAVAETDGSDEASTSSVLAEAVQPARG